MRALRKRGKALGVVAALAGLTVYAAVAFADQIERTIENGVGANVTVAPGDSANVDYWVRAQGGNPPSCDATADPVTVTINLPAGGGVAISDENGDPLGGTNENQLVFNSCDQANSQRVQFTPAGGDGSSYAIPAVSESSAGDGSYSTGGTAFTLNVVGAGGGGDTVDPTITITSPIAGHDYFLNEAVAAVFSCSDDVDVASCDATNDGTAINNGDNINTASIGAHTFHVDALDTSGNDAEADADYNVIWDFDGFFSPVDNGGVYNKAKAGSAIPVKFSLDGDQGLDIMADGYPKSQMILCSNAGDVDGIEQTVNAGQSSLSYDAFADQYVYVWKTDKSWATAPNGPCRQLVVKLDDDESYRANFQFAK